MNQLGVNAIWGTARKRIAEGGGVANDKRVQVPRPLADLDARLRDGVLKAPVEAIYPINKVKQALANAQRSRSGKGRSCRTARHERLGRI